MASWSSQFGQITRLWWISLRGNGKPPAHSGVGVAIRRAASSPRSPVRCGAW
jgi:hypothetical protein